MIVLVKMDDLSGMRDIPYALLFLGDSLEKAGYEVKVFHGKDTDIKEITKFVKNNGPLFVGISTCTGTPTSNSSILSRSIRNACDVPIVWGGVHPSILPEQTLSESYVDFVVIGEGENTIVELADALKNKRDLANILGIGYKKNGKVTINPQRPFETDLGKFDIAWHLIDVESYIHRRGITFDSRRMITYIASRGCPHRCAFCYNVMFNKSKWRPFPIKKVIDDVLMLKREYSVDGIFFWDDNFFVDRRRALDIVKRIDMEWQGEIRAHSLDDALAKKLVLYRCKLLLVGAESGNDMILKFIKKDITTNDLIKANNLCKKHRLPLMCSFIIGFPGESWDEILSTVNFMFKLTKEYPENPVGHLLGVYMPYPGSELYASAVKAGFKSPKRTEDWSVLERYRSDFNLPWLDNKKIDALLKGYHTWTSSNVTKTLWRFDLRLMKVLYEFRVRTNNFNTPYEIYIHRYLRAKSKRLLKSMGFKLPSDV